MNTVELIYQETKDLPETEAREVLDFVEFLKAKRRREFDQFGSVYDGHFDRDACYDRPNLR